MYSGKRNMLGSSYMGYATAGIEWDVITNNGDLSNWTIPNVDVQCRAIAVAPTDANGVQLKYFALRNPEKTLELGVYVYKTLFATDEDGIWKECTPPEVRNGLFNITDVVIDSKDPKRVFVSLGMVDWNWPLNPRVYLGQWDPINGLMNWTNMSSGLSQLPVTCLAYQNGSDDVIYAGTDGGVYRWDKPQGCWVPFDDMVAQNGGTGKMPHVIVHDLEIDYCNRKLVMGSYARGVWESDLYYPNFFPDPTEFITTNTTWNTDKVIEGSILVKSGAILSIQGGPNVNNNTMTSSTTTIYMPKWGRIDVEKGAKLEIEGAHITNACDKNWMGIYAHGKGNQSQTQYLSLGEGYPLASASWNCKNKHINHRNAEEALNNGGGGDYPNTGGIVIAEKSHFINNRRSAAFYKYNNIIGGTLHPDVSKLKENRFDTNDDTRIPFFCHISMWKGY